jgi:hypothetical protein
MRRYVLSAEAVQRTDPNRKRLRFSPIKESAAPLIVYPTSMEAFYSLWS